MINREKLVALSLLTALIITLMFANSNVTSVAADPDPDPDTMTFNSDVTMEFETGNTAWIGSGKYLYIYNETKGENVTELGPGTVLSTSQKPGWGYPNPEPGDWYYVYGDLYGDCIGFEIDQVWGPTGGRLFNISKTWEHWLRTPRNWTGDNDFHKTPLTEFEAEGMISSIETGAQGYWAFVDGKTYNVAPTVGSHWSVTYHDCLFDNVFNISSVGSGYYEEAEDAWYYPVEFGALWNTTGDIVNSITVPDAPEGFCPVEGLEGVQTITTMEPARYYVSSPAPLLPDNSTWWNITSPGELDTTQFRVKNSSKIPFRGIFRSYMDVDNVAGSTDITPPGVKSIEATWANAPKVATIGSWYNVIAGTPPSSRTWWNITDPTSLANVQFYVDAAGGGVFHIDEVLNATSGVSGDIPVSPAADNVTAEELIPFIYIDPAITNTTALGPGNETTISIKTNYTLQVWGYEFTLKWNPDVLNCSGVTNGTILFAGATFKNGTVDNVNGKLSLTGAQFIYTTPPATQVNGPGTLANVTFTVTGTGDSDINLGPETRLIKITKDGKGVEQNVIDDVTGEIKDGYFCNYDGPIVHDVGVTNITCYYYGVDVNETYRAWTVQVNVTVLNNGTLTETFDFELHCESWRLNKTELRIASSTTKTLEFSFDLSVLYYGTRDIWSKVIIAMDITDEYPDDNWLTDPTLVKLTGDLVRDGVVNDTDKMDFIGEHPRPSVPPGENADLDGNGAVERLDFVLLVGNYGRKITYT